MQPAGREQADGQVRGEQQPAGGRLDRGQAVREGGGCRRAGAAPAQQVHPDGVQRAGERAAGRAVARLLPGGEDGVGGELQGDQQGGGPPVAALPAGVRVGRGEDRGADRGERRRR
ncbi:hypothetical protein SAZ_14065 [Streptomyces noursei ZPM]|nr:hypothetical protein SAZ_14065 [Streptomyces noursei ZPM]